jgi:uncharacterized protein with HEPN domain
MQTKGLSERRGLQVVGMSASALRYQPRPDRNVAVRERIVALAQRHRRYGVGMIHLKLRQAGELINYKRVERLYRLEQLHFRRRRRKKIPMSDRQPLIRPGRANEIWSADFVSDRVASGRMIKCLVIVDDATHEAVAIVSEHTIGGDHLTRILGPAAFLWDVNEAASLICEFVVGHNFETFSASVLVQSAVERQFEVIGEALKQISKVAPDIASKIPDCGQIIAFRNILIHGYAVLDKAVVRKVIHQHLPALEKTVQHLLDAEPPPHTTSQGKS